MRKGKEDKERLGRWGKVRKIRKGKEEVEMLKRLRRKGKVRKKTCKEEEKM